jgi:fatty acid desaturase
MHNIGFKYCHLQHHKHTNDPDHDPDHYVASGPTLLLPLKWLSIEVKYYFVYIPLLFSRPWKEALGAVGQLGGIIAASIYLYHSPYWKNYLVCCVIPVSHERQD